MWAFGVVMWETWTGAMVPYWEEENDKTVSQMVVRGERLPRPEGCSEAVWAVMPEQPSTLLSL